MLSMLDQCRHGDWRLESADEVGAGSQSTSSTGRRAGWVVAALAALVMALVPATATAQGLPDEGAQAGAEYYEDTDPAALTDFQATLSPHGTWVDDPTYGTVWVPNVVVVGQNFRPYYTAGHWAVAEDGGWMWVSDYPWGYIPFHYGRWVWIPARGWAWIPGRRYAHAWVTWRVGEPGWDYVGWAPMGPTYVWVDGYAVAYWHVGILPWWFVSSYWLFHPAWHVHVIHDHHHAHQVHGHTHPHHHGDGGPARHPADASAAGGDEHGPASPTSGPGGAPRSLTGRSSAQRDFPSSPSFDDARIPRAARPKGTVAPDARAVSLAKPPADYRAPSSSRATKAGPAGRISAGRTVGSPSGARAFRPQAGTYRQLDGNARSARPAFAGGRPADGPDSRPASAWRPPARRGPSPSAPLHGPSSSRPSSPWASGHSSPATSSRHVPSSRPSSTQSSWRAPSSHSGGPSLQAPSTTSRKSSGKPSRSGGGKSSRGSRSHGHKSKR